MQRVYTQCSTHYYLSLTRNLCYVYIYIYFWYIIIYSCIYVLLSSAPGALNTLVKSVIHCLVTRATPMSPGMDETHVCGCIYIYMVFTTEGLLEVAIES